MSPIGPVEQSELLKETALALQQGDEEKVRSLCRDAVAQGIPAREILGQGLIAGMNVVGELFRNQEIFLPDVLLAARAMYAGMGVIKPLMLKQDVRPIGKVVLGTVQGDLHDIGKNLVGIMLKGAGFEVIDLGNDVAPERFVEAAIKEQASVIGMSTLLTTTMPAMKRTVELARARGLSGKVKIIIGGAPVSAEYARSIGADAYGYDAANAVEITRQVLNTKP